MLTLKAAGLVEIDAGEIVRPGILRIEGDRIAGVGGALEGEVVDLGDHKPPEPRSGVREHGCGCDRAG